MSTHSKFERKSRLSSPALNPPVLSVSVFLSNFPPSIPPPLPHVLLCILKCPFNFFSLKVRSEMFFLLYQKCSFLNVLQRVFFFIISKLSTHCSSFMAICSLLLTFPQKYCSAVSVSTHQSQPSMSLLLRTSSSLRLFRTHWLHC